MPQSIHALRRLIISSFVKEINALFQSCPSDLKIRLGDLVTKYLNLIIIQKSFSGANRARILMFFSLTVLKHTKTQGQELGPLSNNTQDYISKNFNELTKANLLLLPYLTGSLMLNLQDRLGDSNIRGLGTLGTSFFVYIYWYNLDPSNCYVGRTISLKNRVQRHKLEAPKAKECPKFYNFVNKYGWNNMSFQAIGMTTVSEYVGLEQFWLDEVFAAYPDHVLNVQTQATWQPQDIVVSSYTRAKQANAGIGRAVSDESRMKSSMSNAGQLRSPETRAKKSAAQTGRIHSPGTKAKMGLSASKGIAFFNSDLLILKVFPTQQLAADFISIKFGRTLWGYKKKSKELFHPQLGLFKIGLNPYQYQPGDTYSLIGESLDTPVRLSDRFGNVLHDFINVQSCAEHLNARTSSIIAAIKAKNVFRLKYLISYRND